MDPPPRRYPFTMQVLLLPGYSTKNLRERDSLAEALRAIGHHPLPHAWRHWEDEHVEFSLSTELSRIRDLLSGPGGEAGDGGGGPAGGTLAIVGKSIGCFVGAALLDREPAVAARTRRLLLLGVPVAGAPEHQKGQLYEALSRLDMPVTVCQNSRDPYGEAETVREFLQGLPIEFIEEDSDNHRYDYPQLVTEILGRG
jgi:pimeloyl-ACP methyl ester carboxylesterase